MDFDVILEEISSWNEKEIGMLLKLIDHYLNSDVRSNKTCLLSFKGSIFMKLNKDIQAKELLDNAFKMDNNSFIVNLTLAQYYIRWINFTSALEFLDRVIKINPGYLDAMHKKANILIYRKRFLEAISIIREIMKNGHLSSSIFESLALACEGLQKKELAICYCDMALRLNPHSYVGLSTKISYLYRCKEYKEAYELLSRIKPIVPSQRKFLQNKKKKIELKMELQSANKLSLY
jgi:tetratricopeptide (TPR) repeat protein